MPEPRPPLAREAVDVAWFWSFWHWSTERFREGSLLRSPLQGIGSHWDEWYRHEATADERLSIEAIGISRDGQRTFVRWLVRHWAHEAQWRDIRPLPRFVLTQLANLPPFEDWSSFARYRDSFGVAGVSAIVLTGDAQGDPSDVRPVEALLLPLDSHEVAPLVVTEGFDADPVDVMASRHATASATGGSALRRMLAQWIAVGRRPYPRWLALLLAAGWLSIAAMIVYLLIAPDPQGQLVPVEALMLALWLTLLVVAVLVDGAVVVAAWRVGSGWQLTLERSQVRLRMPGGLRVHGASAGLPFTISTLLAVQRATSRSASRAWLWAECLRPLRRRCDTWAATGAIAADGSVAPVVLLPKLQAVLRHPRVRHLLVPRQPEGRQRSINRVGEGALPAARELPSVPGSTGRPQVGFAMDGSRVVGHRCRNVADAILAIGDMPRRSQLTINLVAWTVSVAMLLALPDLESSLWPASAPIVVAPASPSPYYLWVSVDTKRPDQFAVVFESEFWSNRQSNIAPSGGANASVRAEMRFTRRSGEVLAGEEDGTIWIERRRRFLSREFAHGARVGQYTLSYLSRLGHD